MSDRTVSLAIAMTVAAPGELSRVYQASGLGKTSNSARVSKGQPATLRLRVDAPPGRSTIDIGTAGTVVDVSSYHNWETLPYLSDVVALTDDEDLNVGVAWPAR
jgi:hypothetical protein